MRILIIEDEQHAVKLLSNAILSLRPGADILGDVDSVRAALNWLEQALEIPDVIFMDIELADGNSLEIFKHIDIQCPVIFTTAYDQYAVEAFNVNALDYLLKPIEQERLEEALKRTEHAHKNTLDELRHRIDTMVDQFKEPKKQRCLVKHGGVFDFVNVSDIALAYSEEGLTFLLTDDGRRHVYGRSIEELGNELDGRRFFQVNRAVIVGIENINRVHPYIGQRLKLDVAQHGALEEVIVSRKRASDFKAWLDS